MVLRLKTRFRTKGPRTLEQRATVIAANIWKIAQEACRRMEVAGFKLGGDRQVSAMLTEIIAFLIQITDRIVYGQLPEEDRRKLINELGQHLARTMQENMTEYASPGDYAGPFVVTLNARFADYAQCEYTAQGPGYAFVRCLGERVSEAMATTDNKWVIEHVMEIEVPEAVKAAKKLVGEVLGVKAG